jgi:hypothetical protein
VNGCEWKCANTTREPRRIMRAAATGESIPLETSASTFPDEPTGKPPAPRTRSA